MTFAAFGVWLEDHYGDLLAVAKSRMRDQPASAEDVLHEALLAMWQNPALDLAVQLSCSEDDRKAGHVAVWVWATGIIRYTAKDWRLRQSVTPHLIGEGDRPDRIRLRRLRPEIDTTRWVATGYCRRLEQDRQDYDMGGYRERGT